MNAPVCNALGTMTESPVDLVSDWKLDEGFVENAMNQAASADVVSFDIFDTAVTRIVDSPIDAFAEMERRLIAEFGDAAKGFAEAREHAERDARAKHHAARGAEEVDFQAVYAALPARIPSLAKHVDRAAEVELEVERSILVAVPDILELTRRLSGIGKPFVFVSDMYLPGSFLEEVLRGVGYEGWAALYVSSETLATKATGRQWSIIEQRYSPLDRILHIGDDAWSDGINPTRYKVRTLVYERARSERRVGARLSPALLPFSLAQRNVVLRSRATPSTEIAPAEHWRNLGRVLGGIVLAGFTRWLASRVKQHKIDKLYFCARDGWLVQRAWKAAGMDRETGIEDHYLCISRRPLNLARGYIESTPTYLPRTLIDFLCSTNGRTTVRAALERTNLSGIASIESDLIERYGSLDVVYAWTHGPKPLEEVLRKHSATVRERLKETHASLIGYLNEENLGTGGRAAIVDMGWHATMQRSLKKLMETENISTSLLGFYYGLWPAALGNRYKAGLLESAFATDFMPVEQQPEVHSAVEILEELHTAPHGTVVSYEQRDGKWRPVFADSPLEFAQYDTMTRHFQDGALETVAELFATGKCGTLVLDEITPDVVRAALGSICMSPSSQEVQLIGQLGHCATFDHSILDRLIPGECPEDDHAMRTTFWPSGWRVGTLRSWYDAAQTPEQRARLRQFAHEAFHYFSERTLRQFN